MSVEKFVEQYTAFISNPVIAALPDPSKVTMFQIYCQIMTSSKPQAPVKPNAAPSTSGPSASTKQIGLIRNLISDGSLSADVLKNRLSLKEASNLIEKGLAVRKSREEEPVEQPADYAGAFNWGGE